jgi:predicted Zn-dependent protease with MMP-like domain
MATAPAVAFFVSEGYPGEMKRFRQTVPTLADIERIAETALATIPEPLRRHAKDVVLRIEEFCDDETARELELDSPFDLLGLYRGVSLARQSISDVREDVDMVFLYRRPILEHCRETGESLSWVVRDVLMHEIGHHFGFSDEDMERIEDEA